MLQYLFLLIDALTVDSKAHKNYVLSFQTVFLSIIICERELEKISQQSGCLGLYCIACIYTYI